jgi:TonB family protein
MFLEYYGLREQPFGVTPDPRYLYFSGLNELLGITSSFDPSDDVVLPSPTYNSDRLFSVAEQVKQHELVSRIPPQYLLVARRGRVEGDVVVNFVVKESANASDMNIVSGPMMLRQAALNASRGWNYKPSQLAGQPVAETSLHLP